MDLIKAGLEDFPKLLWFLLPLMTVMKAFIVEVLESGHYHKYMEYLHGDSESIRVDEILAFMRGISNLTASILSTAYVEKYVISLTGYFLLCTSSIPLYLISSLKRNSDKTMHWNRFPAYIRNFLIFGETTMFILMCEQFKLPELSRPFYLFILLGLWLDNLAVVIGSILIRVLTKFENLRWHIEYQYSLLFGALASIIFLGFLVSFKNQFYRRRIPSLTLTHMFHYFRYLMQKKWSLREENKQEVSNFEWFIIEDTKNELNWILSMIILVPFMILRQEKYASTWTYQYSKLDVQIFLFIIYPHEGRAVIALFNLILFPIAHLILFPWAYRKLIFNTPLKYISLGYLFLGFAYIWALGLEIIVEQRNSHMHNPNVRQLRIYNTMTYPVRTKSSITGDINITSYGMKNFIRKFSRNAIVELILYAKLHVSGRSTVSAKIQMFDQRGITCLITKNGIKIIKGSDSIYPSYLNRPKIYFFCASEYCGNGDIVLEQVYTKKKVTQKIPNSENKTEVHLNGYGNYNLYINKHKIPNPEPFLNNGVYSFVIFNNGSDIFTKRYTIVQPSSVHYFWAIPQYIMLSFSDVTAGVALKIFLYRQSPINLRCINFGIIYFLTSLGEIAITEITQLNINTSTQITFEVMAVFILLLCLLYLAIIYRYRQIVDGSRDFVYIFHT